MVRTVKQVRKTNKQKLESPKGAATFLVKALDGAGADEFLTALRSVVDARFGVQGLAEAAGLNRESLYRTLSPAGNPRLVTLMTVLDALGLQLSIKAKA